MAVSGQKRGSSVHVQLHDDMKNVTNVAELKDGKMKVSSKKSDRQGLNILDPVTFRQDDLGYEEELPLPEYRPQVTILGCDWPSLGDTER